ncbi:hypothetical protein HYV84_00940 [Candidatus Woesearchaeota archaeon]|nr:hypothetical protein [Candidatus Woesearchaeota archaeon]
MSDTLEGRTNIEGELERQLHPGIDGALALNCIGTVGAGKSTFLAGVHQELGYSNIGARIKRGRPMHVTSFYGAHAFGRTTRSNATLYQVDQMEVYGQISGGFVKIHLLAPGSHSSATRLAMPEDAAAFFLDLSLYERVVSIIRGGEPLEFFPFRETMGVHPAWDVRGRGEKKSVVERFAQMPGVFKRMELGVVIESLLCAQENLVALTERGVPVIGIQTYPSENQGGLSLPVDAALADKGFNTLIGNYLAYLEKKDFPNYNRLPTRPNTSHNDRIRGVDFSRLVGLWYPVDSIPTVRKGVKEAMHAFAVAALQHKGISSDGFRLLRFSKPYLGDDGITQYHDVKKKHK